MEEQKIACDAVGAGCARIQSSEYFARPYNNSLNTAQIILDSQIDPEQYCWTAYTEINSRAPGDLPEHMRQLIRAALQDDSDKKINNATFNSL